MKTKAPTSKRRRCPACGAGFLQPKTVTKHLGHELDGKWRPVTVTKMPVEVCTQCGEQFSGPEAAKLHHEAICRAFGFLTPAEICTLRQEVLGLTQEEFAQLTGIGLATISRWERGRLVQNRAMDTYLRLLKANPANIRLLRSLPSFGQPPPPQTQEGQRFS
jgi:putative zinc finger/helix-turn-helix YgiT family protein